MSTDRPMEVPMRRDHTTADAGPDDRAGPSGRRILAILAAAAVLSLAGALHLVGVLPPGG